MRLNVSFFPPHFPRLFFANFCRNSRNLPFESKFELTRHFFQLEYYNTEKKNWIRLRWNSTYITILSYSILFPNHFRVYLNCIKLYFLKNFVTWYPWVKIAWNKDLCNTFTSHTKFCIWQNSSFWVIVQDAVDFSDCTIPKSLISHQ